jgi:hypothetical protein
MVALGVVITQPAAANPYYAGFVFKHFLFPCQTFLAGKKPVGVKVGKPANPCIQAAYPHRCTYPQVATVIFGNTGYPVVYKGAAVAYIPPVNLNVPAIVPVKPVKSANPYKPLAVLVNTFYIITAKPLQGCNAVKQKPVICLCGSNACKGQQNIKRTICFYNWQNGITQNKLVKADECFTVNKWLLPVNNR